MIIQSGSTMSTPVGTTRVHRVSVIPGTTCSGVPHAASTAAHGRPSKSERLYALWVPRTSSTSRDQAIFVDQAADVSVFSDAMLLKIDRLG